MATIYSLKMNVNAKMIHIFASFTITGLFTQIDAETAEIIATKHGDQEKCPNVNAIVRTNIEAPSKGAPSPVSIIPQLWNLDK